MGRLWLLLGRTLPPEAAGRQSWKRKVIGTRPATKFFGCLFYLDFRQGNIWSERSAAVLSSTSRSTANFKDRSHWPRAAAGLRHSRAPLASKNFVIHPVGYVPVYCRLREKLQIP